MNLQLNVLVHIHTLLYIVQFTFWYHETNMTPNKMDAAKVIEM